MCIIYQQHQTSVATGSLLRKPGGILPKIPKEYKIHKII